ncbi:MAG: hypothetical protein K8R59_02750, partial [Thermoanaerobaculales bacterium]|nr:hypothetical protein [Thermoanaerobaculales bacterium]
AYAFTLVGLGQAKVMASAFFAQRETKTPMWCSLASLVVFAVGCFVLAGKHGTPGIGLANTIAVGLYAVILTVVYSIFFGFGGKSKIELVRAIARQVVGCAALGIVIFHLAPWLADVQTTSLVGLVKVGGAALAAGAAYILVVLVLGGREISAMWIGFRGDSTE